MIRLESRLVLLLFSLFDLKQMKTIFENYHSEHPSLAY